MKEGFTLLELIIVIVIIGILASSAIPKFTITIERARAAEGVEILGDLRQAQIRYHTIKNDWATDISELDVEIVGVKFFKSISVRNPEGYPLGVVAMVNRVSKRVLYILGITEDGEVRCENISGAYCFQLGYPPLY